MFILIKLPSRGRPNKLVDVLTKYVRYAKDITKIFFMVTLDTDDPTTGDVIQTLINIHPNIRVTVGMSGTKVKAINRDMDTAPPFDILVLTSDDMIPQVHGYDEIIRNAMIKHFPTTDGVVWFNDGIQGMGLNTLPILGRKYYERFGYIYNPIYKTAWCDNEFTNVARILGKQVYYSQVIIEHHHIINGKAAIDQTYLKNDDGLDTDGELYRQRERAGFGVNVWFKLPKINVKIYK